MATSIALAVSPASISATYLVLTVEEAAEQLRIGRTQMYQLVMTGTVESVLIGRLRRVPIECLREYVTDLLAAGASQKTMA
ncbi:helix-turn-helix domain-containing protein [Streptosporangium sp. NPDC001559]|uniref:helix-turn-helix domain-containing protein n=1 Tax=Streptosporangium sp. NPDC001559 TaxID=3366187 RepID=UPI0036EABC6E